MKRMLFLFFSSNSIFFSFSLSPLFTFILVFTPREHVLNVANIKIKKIENRILNTHTHTHPSLRCQTTVLYPGGVLFPYLLSYLLAGLSVCVCVRMCNMRAQSCGAITTTSVRLPTICTVAAAMPAAS